MKFCLSRLRWVLIVMLLCGLSTEVQAEVLQPALRKSDELSGKLNKTEQLLKKTQVLKLDSELKRKQVESSQHAASDLLLGVEEALTEDDSQLDDESLYDLHLFEGQAGQIIRITLTSDEFDTLLVLQDADGEQLAHNDDSNAGTNSEIVFRLPTTAQYLIWVNAYDANSGGVYRLTVATADEKALRQAELASEADNLFRQGAEDFRISRYNSAEQAWKTALELYRELNNRQGEANTLSNLGLSHESLGQYQQALEFQQQALEIAREIEDFRGEAISLSRIGIIYGRLDEYQRASEAFQQSLRMSRDIGNRLREANALGNLSLTYYNLGNHQRAIELQQQYLEISQEIGNRQGEATSLGNLGIFYRRLGDYRQAIEFYQRALAIKRDIGDRQGEAIVLGNLGTTYGSLDEYQQAIEYQQQALAIKREIGDRLGEATSLGAIGSTYNSLGDYWQAIGYHQQALAIRRDIGDRRGEAISLGSLGFTYNDLGEYQQAIDALEQTLAITRDIGDRQNEATALNNLGFSWQNRGRPEIAAIFYKNSINVYETIRDDILGLDLSLQNTYTALVEKPYRSLIDILLEQGRILEAQQVLELLKVEELREFTRASYESGQIRYDPAEKPIVDAHGNLINLGAEIAACEPNCDQSLYDQQIALESAFDATVETFEDTIRSNRAEDDVFYDPNNLASDALDIVNAQDGTVLIYPVVLEDTLWLLWTSTGGVVGSVEVPAANQAELSKAVLQFRELLTGRDEQSLAELKEVGQQLHSWLIEPLSTELEANNIQNLVFAQDRATRYLPMAALHDGEQFLLEKYTISTVLSAALTDTTDRLGDVSTANTLGLGLDEAKGGFSALPNVREELQSVIQESDADTTGIYPGSVFMNEDFTFETLSQQVRRHRILHIATHAEFVPNIKDASYLLDGNGERLTIDQIGSLDTQFNNLHLVILSACQTALGGTSLDGTEIAGVSSYFLGKNKAEAVLATLWRVDDAGTSLLMRRFYEFMATGQLTKAEALRQAQLSLLSAETTLDERFENLGIQRDGFILEAEVANSSPVTIDHPYYWAPFVLIGNSL